MRNLFLCLCLLSLPSELVLAETTHERLMREGEEKFQICAERVREENKLCVDRCILMDKQDCFHRCAEAFDKDWKEERGGSAKTRAERCGRVCIQRCKCPEVEDECFYD